jgi:hypothetical protein
LAAWSFFMRDPQRGGADQVNHAPRGLRVKEYLILLKTPSYVLNTLGMTAMTFALGALAWWMPRYLRNHSVADFHGHDPRFIFGVLTAVAGLTATLAGGSAGDRLRNRFAGSYFLVSGVGLLLAVPCVLLFLIVPFPAAWGFIFLAEFFLFFNTGPTNAILANVTHPAMRATAFALNILVIHVFGDAISPPVVGAISDVCRRLGVAPENSLDYGFVFVAAFLALGGWLWLKGVRHLEADTKAAPHRLDGAVSGLPWPGAR